MKLKPVVTGAENLKKGRENINIKIAKTHDLNEKRNTNRIAKRQMLKRQKGVESKKQSVWHGADSSSELHNRRIP